MNIKTDSLLGRYLQWLSTHSTERELEGGWTELTVPFLDRHNDHLRVYARQESNGLRITDDGETLRDLGNSGFEITGSTKRETIAKQILKNFGIDHAAPKLDELHATAVNGDFGWKLHHLFLSMMAIDGMSRLSPSRVANSFEQDVAGWLRGAGAKFEEAVPYRGISGVERIFDFRVPAHDGGKPKVLQSIATPDKLHIQSFAYEVRDTRDAMNGDSPEFFAVLNSSSPVNKKQYKSFLASKISPITWSKRHEHASKFVA